MKHAKHMKPKPHAFVDGDVAAMRLLMAHPTYTDAGGHPMKGAKRMKRGRGKR